MNNQFEELVKMLAMTDDAILQRFSGYYAFRLHYSRKTIPSQSQYDKFTREDVDKKRLGASYTNEQINEGGVYMPTATVRIPEDKGDILKIIAGIEKRDIGKILTDLIDDYIESHRETLALLSKPE